MRCKFEGSCCYPMNSEGRLKIRDQIDLLQFMSHPRVVYIWAFVNNTFTISSYISNIEAGETVYSVHVSACFVINYVWAAEHNSTPKYKGKSS